MSGLTHRFAARFGWTDLPPAYQQKNRWLEKHYHGLRWTSGTLPYNTANDVLTPLFVCSTRIVVNGLENIAWLRQLIGGEVPIDDLKEVPSLRKMAIRRRTADNMETLAQWLKHIV